MVQEGESPSATIEMRLRVAIQDFHLGNKSAELAKEFERLVKEGAGEGSYFLGLMHEDGTNGFAVNNATALSHYKASIASCGYSEGFLAAARFAYYGKIGPPDYSEAFKLYSHIAAQGNFHVACFMLGRMYQLGQGVDKDNKLARSWYERAVDQGSAWGMMYMATLEAEEGHWLRFLRLRIRAIKTAWTLRRRRQFDGAYDIRLRPS